MASGEDYIGKWSKPGDERNTRLARVVRDDIGPSAMPSSPSPAGAGINDPSLRAISALVISCLNQKG